MKSSPPETLSAVVGDFLDKPVTVGGLALNRFSASAALFCVHGGLHFYFSPTSGEAGTLIELVVTDRSLA